MRFAYLFPIAVLAACQPQQEGEPVARVQVGGTPSETATPSPSASIASQVESACRQVIFENTPLTDCIAIPERHRIATALAGPGGNFRSLAAFAATRDPKTIAFAVNAGMFDEAGDPIGYFVQGHSLRSRHEPGCQKPAVAVHDARGIPRPPLTRTPVRAF